MIIHTGHLCVFSELVQHRPNQLIRKAKGDGLLLAVEHFEGFLCVSSDLPAEGASRFRYGIVEDPHAVNSVHAVVGGGLMLFVVGDEIVIILIEYQRHRLHDVFGSVPAVCPLAGLGHVKVFEGHFPILHDGVFQIAHGVVHGFIPVLSGVEFHHIALEYSCSMAAAQGSNLVHQLAGLLLGHEAGRLHGIDQDLELRDTEAPVTHEVSFFVADQSFRNLIALFVQ